MSIDLRGVFKEAIRGGLWAGSEACLEAGARLQYSFVSKMTTTKTVAIFLEVIRDSVTAAFRKF